MKHPSLLFWWAVCTILLGGLALAYRADFVDDSYIFLRYAQNIAEGHGPVFNIGERVEGYSSALWTFTISMIGLVPGFFPPSANLNTTAACALVVVVWTHVIGIKYHGAGYIKHFMGPVWWMAPLIFLIEIIGHAARILSLSFRLFGNMMGH